MKGAGQYFNPITQCFDELGLEHLGAHQYYINHLVFNLGKHEGGCTMEIYLIEDPDELKKRGLYNTKKIEVYGKVDGVRGFDEIYGWKRKGKWVQFCEKLLKQSLKVHKKHTKEQEKLFQQRHRLAEKEKQNLANQFNKYF